MRFWASLMVAFVLCLVCSTVYGEEASPSKGVTAWVLGGGTGSDDGRQEARVGYVGLFPTIEFAAGVMHVDAPDQEDEQFAFKGYVIAHALDAATILKAFKLEITLPDGVVYGGLFGEYVEGGDQEEIGGGYVVGALVDLDKTANPWQLVAEYEGMVWEPDHNEIGGDGYTFVAGLRKLF